MEKFPNPFVQKAHETVKNFASEKQVPLESWDKYSSGDRERRLEAVAEYISAGKNLANFCRRLSKREKKASFSH